MKETYISTGDKLFRHPEAIADLCGGRRHPILLHVMPTEACNLRCGFCSLANRGNTSLGFDSLQSTVSSLNELGLKAVIFSGGGEPLLYPDISEAVRFCIALGLEVGLITNGTRFDRLDAKALSELKWVRISMNSLDSLEDIRIPDLPASVTLGMSYIWHRETEPGVLARIRAKAAKHHAVYVRLIPDCDLGQDEFKAIYERIDEFVAVTGKPFFAHHKDPMPAGHCYLPAVHPVLYADGFIYPCDSVMHNHPDERRFHERYRLCQWSEVRDFYARPLNGDFVNVADCPRCAFVPNNDLLARIIGASRLEHLNFI